ncbi:hypothetical protein BN8_05236 [Fibrisoma limi BUZ 3]|uniref:Uncharacterized protein n=1 Tax=Fibrisoma limi BUZ 3 TaxID=1185876 RepID=I2GPV8_9BACT|nr:hypothetical protein [Fibrisoma limi]CCH55936.1 hypothetical protein BN8_05236 [Fibrisoma limi BUZ 3]
MTTDHHTETKKTTPKNRFGLNPIIVLYGVIILLVAGLGYLFYRNWQLNNQLENERTSLRATAWQNQVVNDRNQLTFAMKTFVWAVRNAMLQNKPGEINEYFNTIVQNKGVREVLLVDPAGKVTLSTNKKNQGIAFADRFPAYLLGKQDIYFNNKIPYELSAPVTGPNQRLGTLVMFYTPTPVLTDPATAP